MKREMAAELLSENLKNIFAFSVSKVFDKEEAEDLTNDIIVAVLSSVERLESDEAFYGFMWRIAENTLKNHIRKKRTGDSRGTASFYGVNWGTPEEEVVRNEELAYLRRELSILSKQYRKVTIRYYIKNQTVSEISEELDISEEMVKYYLFKTRKILKEGIGMQRNLGEKSYNPGVFGVDFWGGGDNSYVWETFERKLPGNIVLAAYKKPLRFEDLSLELGVAAPYLEDELDILLKYNFIKQVGNKYQTNIIIFEKPFEEELRRKLPATDICKSAVKSIFERIDELLPQVKNIDLGIELNENELRWFAVNFALVNALDDFDNNKMKVKFGPYPQLTAKCCGVVFGHDNDYEYGYFNGIYGNENPEKTAIYNGVNYKVIEKCQSWQPHSKARARALFDSVLQNPIGDNDEETVAQLISENVLCVCDGCLKARFPVISAEINEFLLKKLQDIIGIIQNCMVEICERATQILERFTPENLLDKCEYICFLRHQSDTIGVIVEELVKTGYLKVPDEQNNLCVYGVRK